MCIRDSPLGVPPLEFHYRDGKKEHLDNFFSEGGSGNGDIHNMIEVFNLISINLLKNELVEELVWYEYGQIMTKCYEWTYYLETKGPSIQYYNEVLERSSDMSWFDKIKLKRTFLNQYIDPKSTFSFFFNKYMEKNKKKNIRRAVKHYTYIE